MKTFSTKIDGKEIPSSMIRETADGPLLSFRDIMIKLSMSEADEAIGLGPSAIVDVFLVGYSGETVHILQKSILPSKDELVVGGVHGSIALPR